MGGIWVISHLRISVLIGAAHFSDTINEGSRMPVVYYAPCYYSSNKKTPESSITPDLYLFMYFKDRRSSNHTPACYRTLYPTSPWPLYLHAFWNACNLKCMHLHAFACICMQFEMHAFACICMHSSVPATFHSEIKNALKIVLKKMHAHACIPQRMQI